MRKTMACLILVSGLSLGLGAQGTGAFEALPELDDGGLAAPGEGSRITYYPSGARKEVITLDQAGNGKYESFQENGSLKVAGEYQGRKMSGWWVIYDGKGFKSSEYHYRDGKRDGNGATYYPSGAVSGRTAHADGASIGMMTAYYESGEKQFEVPEIGETISGPIKFYFKSGKLQGEGNYVNGKLEGPLTTYYESGAVAERSTLANGALEGEKVAYYENGVVSMRTEYVNDLEHGLRRTFAKDGSPLAEGPMRFGVMHGWVKLFEVRKEALYVAGKLVTSRDMK